MHSNLTSTAQMEVADFWFCYQLQIWQLEGVVKKLKMDLKKEPAYSSYSEVSCCLMDLKMQWAYSSCSEVSSCPLHLMDSKMESGYSSCSEVSCWSLHLPCPPSDGGELWQTLSSLERYNGKRNLHTPIISKLLNFSYQQVAEHPLNDSKLMLKIPISVKGCEKP